MDHSPSRRFKKENTNSSSNKFEFMQRESSKIKSLIDLPSRINKNNDGSGLIKIDNSYKINNNINNERIPTESNCTFNNQNLDYDNRSNYIKEKDYDSISKYQDENEKQYNHQSNFKEEERRNLILNYTYENNYNVNNKDNSSRFTHLNELNSNYKLKNREKDSLGGDKYNHQNNLERVDRHVEKENFQKKPEQIEQINNENRDKDQDIEKRQLTNIDEKFYKKDYFTDISNFKNKNYQPYQREDSCKKSDNSDNYNNRSHKREYERDLTPNRNEDKYNKYNTISTKNKFENENIYMDDDNKYKNDRKGYNNFDDNNNQINENKKLIDELQEENRSLINQNTAIQLKLKNAEIDLKNKEDKLNKFNKDKNDFDERSKDMEDHYLKIIKEKDMELFEIKKKVNKLDKTNTKNNDINFLIRDMKTFFINNIRHLNFSEEKKLR